MKLVTVIIPVYNGGNKISNVLKDILNQTYSNLEIIVINDGSKDNTKEVCEKYAKQDERIYIINKENGGVSEARNFGLNKSRGQLICFADADDSINSTWIEELVKALEDTDADLAMCGYEKRNIISKETIVVGKDGVWNRDIALEECMDTLGGFLWNKIFKKEIIMQNKMKFYTDVFECEDLLFVCEYIMKIKKVVSISNVLYFYDVSLGNKRTKEQKQSRLRVVLRLIEMMKNDKGTSKIVRELLAEYIVKSNKWGEDSVNKEYPILESVNALFFSRHYTMKEKIYNIYLYLKNRQS